jgi:hypothetical protein
MRERGAAPARPRSAALVGGLADGIVECGLTACRGISSICSSAHGFAIRVGLLGPVRLPFGDIGPGAALRALWFTRIGRELLAFCVRTPLHTAVERRVESAASESGPVGVVVVMFHSPVDRLLRSWCFARGAAEIVHRQTRGIAELRRLVRLVRSGGRVVVFVDAAPVSPGCTVGLFGRRFEITLFPARLAAAAGVPLMPAIFVWTPASLSLRLGETQLVRRGRAAAESASREVIRFFEAQLEKNPELWKGIRTW